MVAIRAVPVPHVYTSLLATAVLGLAACSKQTTEPSQQATTVYQRTGIVAPTGAVYISTNGADGNAIVGFRRAADGSLSPLGTTATGGKGIGGAVDPLTSQSALVLDEGHRFLFAVNAGSNDVSSFRVGSDGGLTLAGRASARGVRPVSLAVRHERLYVLNAGDNTVSGLLVTPGGRLVPIPHATRRLADGADGASTIAFTADGDRLIVTERQSNRIETFAVHPGGRLGAPVVTASSGATPFGFDVTESGLVLVTEAAGGAAPNGAVSAYTVRRDGSLVTVTGSLDAQGAGTCWVVATHDGRFAFIANSASNHIAAAAINGGALQILDPQAGVAADGATPLDLDLADGDHFLYALNGRNGTVGGFAVHDDGSLTPAGSISAGAPAGGLQGIAAY